MSRYDKFQKEENVFMDIVKISNSAWTDLNSNNSILKLHDMCANKNCNCQKQINFYT